MIKPNQLLLFVDRLENAQGEPELFSIGVCHAANKLGF
jgi:hypothetical protein